METVGPNTLSYDPTFLCSVLVLAQKDLEQSTYSTAPSCAMPVCLSSWRHTETICWLSAFVCTLQ